MRRPGSPSSWRGRGLREGGSRAKVTQQPRGGAAPGRARPAERSKGAGTHPARRAPRRAPPPRGLHPGAPHPARPSPSRRRRLRCRLAIADPPEAAPPPAPPPPPAPEPCLPVLFSREVVAGGGATKAEGCPSSTRLRPPHLSLSLPSQCHVAPYLRPEVDPPPAAGSPAPFPEANPVPRALRLAPPPAGASHAADRQAVSARRPARRCSSYGPANQHLGSACCLPAPFASTDGVLPRRGSLCDL